MLDGFNAEGDTQMGFPTPGGEKSRHPIYRVERISSGVSGKPKNLIFAAIRRKPDLYFVDAINKDVGIGNASDALIYDQFLSDTGLLWRTLAEWWQARQSLGTLEEQVARWHQ